MAMIYFAGGDPLDIASIHHVNENEQRKSLWIAVDVIYATKSFNIVFPAASRATQIEKKSKANFENLCKWNSWDACITYKKRHAEPELL